MDSGTLGHFTLLEKIGEGGMGRVYKARDTRLARHVAIKLLPESRVSDPDRRARFIQEAKSASALNHPNIVTIHDIGEHDGQTFIVMELVEGKPLQDVIPRKGMRLTEALRIAAQVGDALAAAHAAGIVHRDLKPANIMVDPSGRVKVLDFGLAKLAAPPAGSGVDQETRTVSMVEARTEEGTIVGSVPYMSPEQAEGRPVDARSDIFSFGAVLYEMVTGQRAFRGESRVSTLAAVVEKEPQAISDAAPATPPELERIISRCLRKDVSRRSQSMADVKLALEELRDESESGKLARRAAVSAPGGARWRWPAIAGVCALAAIAAFVWTARRPGVPTHGPELVRVSPDDGQNYLAPAISPDGKFVAYLSDRGGKRDVWLQQVGSGDPIQLTHHASPVQYVSFLPDGTRLLYLTSAAGGASTIESIPILGGAAKVLLSTSKPIWGLALSPDGRQLAFLEYDLTARLMVMPVSGGPARELPSWARVRPSPSWSGVAWTPDSANLMAVGSTRQNAPNYDEWDWFLFPADGGEARPTGASGSIRAAGLRLTTPAVMSGDRVLFSAAKGEQENAWEIRLAPGSWRAQGPARQLTFGTENTYPASASAGGLLALEAARYWTNVFEIPLHGEVAGPVRRLTQDGRYKYRWAVGGNPDSIYFRADDPSSASPRTVGYELALETGKQELIAPATAARLSAVTSDGTMMAYTVADGESFSIRVGERGRPPEEGRLVCKGCGTAERFSADGKYLFISPESKVKPDPARKRTLRLLEIASGKHHPWLEHPTDSMVEMGLFGENSAWVMVVLRRSNGSTARYVVPWGLSAPAPSEWIEVPLGSNNSNYSITSNYFYYFKDAKLVAIRFDAKRKSFGEPVEIRLPSGPGVSLKPDDVWSIRKQRIVFFRAESKSSVWLMQLPR